MNIQIKKIFYGAILTPILEIIYSHSLRYFENTPKSGSPDDSTRKPTNNGKNIRRARRKSRENAGKIIGKNRKIFVDTIKYWMVSVKFGEYPKLAPFI